MKKYKIQFYYNADNRTEWVGEATSDYAALMVAMFDLKIEEWCSSPEFSLKITRVE